MKRIFSLLICVSLTVLMLLSGCSSQADDPIVTDAPLPNESEDVEDEVEVTEPTEKERPCVDIVLFIGQSNMAGRGKSAEATKVEVGHAYEFRAISDPTMLYHLEEPFGVNENNPESGVNENKKSGSMVSAFCESYYSQTGVPIVAVSCSKGGERISFFDVGTKVYQDACDRVLNAQKFLAEKTDFEVRNTYVVWLQGESDGDKGIDPAKYTEALDRIVNGFKEDIGCAQTFVIPIGAYNGDKTELAEKYAAIRDAQFAYCEDNENATVISRQLLDLQKYGYMKDAFHFKQAGYEIVGKDAGANMAYFVINDEKPECLEYTE